MQKAIIRPQYIGITGFMDISEVNEILDLIPLALNIKLMVGVLADYDTLYNNKETNRYPKLENIAKIFPSNPLAINLIHYNTKNTENLCEQLTLLSKYGGHNFHGFQLNMTWPPVEELYEFRSKYPEYILVLVVTDKAFKEESIELITSKIFLYKEMVDIDYVLLDRSEGRGILLDPKSMEKYIEAIKTGPNVKIVVAGGLSSKTLNIVEPLIKKYPYINIDAEDRLRDDNDNLNINFAKDYMSRALQIYENIYLSC